MFRPCWLGLVGPWIAYLGTYLCTVRGRRATADSRHLVFVSATWVVSAALWPTRRVARDMSANVGDIVNVAEMGRSI